MFVHASVGPAIGDLQIQLKVPSLISCIGKIDKFPKFLVVASEHIVLKL